MAEKPTPEKPQNTRSPLIKAGAVVTGVLGLLAVFESGRRVGVKNSPPPPPHEVVMASAADKIKAKILAGQELLFLDASIVKQLPHSYTRIIDKPIVEFTNGETGSPENPFSMRYFTAEHDIDGNPEVREVEFDPTDMSLLIGKGKDPYITASLAIGPNVGQRTPTDALPYVLEGRVDMNTLEPVPVAQDFIAPPDYASMK